MPTASDSLPTRLNTATMIWTANGRTKCTIAGYCQWVRRFEDTGGGIDTLTSSAVERFAVAYARNRRIPRTATIRTAVIALKSWSNALHIAGYRVPEWRAASPGAPLPPILAEYAAFRTQHRGVAPSTNAREVPDILAFMAEFTGITQGPVCAIRLQDVDDYVTAIAGRLRPRTTSRVCSSIRSFLRFLHLKGYLDNDLAASVTGPVLRALDRPPRALAWEDVQRLLAAVDTRRRTGRRDYAILLLMATYGMGTAEVLHLQLGDIDWRVGTIHVVRPKTGVNYLLPLLAGPADALLAYLQNGRPRRVATRAIFVTAGAPYGPLSSAAVRHSVRFHATRAGLSGARLGGHVLRHSHACRQIELAAPPAVVSEILGHRDPASTSSYFRVATERLRELALPLPK